MREQSRYSRVPPVMAVVCESNMTALWGEATLFIPHYECNSPVARSECDRLVSAHRFYPDRLIEGPLL